MHKTYFDNDDQSLRAERQASIKLKNEQETVGII